MYDIKSKKKLKNHQKSKIENKRKKMKYKQYNIEELQNMFDKEENLEEIIGL